MKRVTMNAILTALRNKQKPVLPFLALGIICFVSVIHVMKEWGEYSYIALSSSISDVLASVLFLAYLVGMVLRYSESLFRFPIATLMFIDVLVDLWLWWSRSEAVYDLRALIVECLWLAATIFLYCDTSAADKLGSEER